MDHSHLISELPEIERMTPQQRIELAKERREQQLAVWRERERILPPPAPRRPRLQFSPEVALLEATIRNDPQEVERLLMHGVDPDSHNEDGLTPLHQCAIDNNELVVQLLLRYGANVNSKDTELWSPLHAAACCGYIEIARILIANGADLLAVNADGNMPYDICDDEATLDLIESEMANRGITQEGIDERRGYPEKKMLDDMKLLKQRDPSRDFRDSLLNVRMEDGSTYLHIAAANGYYDVVAFLLRCGMGPSVRDNDLWMPIHAAANWNHPDIIELLCEYGSEINAKTNTGETPLELAEDDQTQQLIRTLAQNEARKKRSAFGVRDSRRQSKRRKKFESPQQLPPPPTDNNPFSARGAIRRQSLRDKSGMTPARLEAQQEMYDLIRSYSKEDVSANQVDDVSSFPYGPSTSTGQRVNARESPKRIIGKQQKNKPMPPDEWLRKLEAESAYRDEDEYEDETNANLQRAVSGRRKSGRKKKGANADNPLDQSGPNEGITLNGSSFGTFKPESNESGTRRKKRWCCLVL